MSTLHRKSRGFTLAELMVVLSIIVLLVAVIMPYFRGVWTTARKTVCARNLNQIGVAYASRKSDEAMNKFGALYAISWTGTLLRYMGDSKDLLRCPEDDPEKFQNRYNIPDLSAYSIYDKSTKFFMALEEAPLTAKLNDQQMASFDPQEVRKGRDPPAYEDDGTGVWWFTFEDLRTNEAGTTGGGDCDFEDIMVHCRILDDGSTELDIIKGGSGHGFAFADPDHKILPGFESIDKNKKYIYKVNTGAMATSYGMNSRVDEINPGTKVLLAMDYEQHVANCGGEGVKDTIDDWTESPHSDDGEVFLFARHKGRANVLWADGAVDSWYPDDINVAVQATRDHLWDPRPTAR